MPRIQVELERFDRVDDREESSSESFDRIAFAERAISLVRPPRMRVAICEGTKRVSVMSGRRWGAEPGARWAIVTIPRNASRRAIVTAVLEMTEGSARAWALDVLMAELGQPSSPMRMFGAR